MKLYEIPPEIVERIAREAIAAYIEFRDDYGYEPEEAEAAAVHEVVEGFAVDPDAIRAERAGEYQISALDSADWPY